MLTRMLRRFRASASSVATTATVPSVVDAEAAEQLRREGNTHLAQGRLDEAAAAYRQAIACMPTSAALHVNLGFTLKEQGLLDQAEEPLRRAVSLDSDSFDARYLFGMVLAALGKAEPALVELQAALALQPGFAAGHAEICRLLLSTGQADRATEWMLAAIDKEPQQASLHMLLGNLHAHNQRAVEAVACFQRSIELEPGFAEARSNLGLLLEQQGRLPEAIDQFRKAADLAVGFAEVRSNLLHTLSCDPDTSPEAYLREARRCGDALRALARPFTSWSAAEDRRSGPLRVGLLCGGFRTHPIGHFLEALLAQWDTRRIELYAYAANPFDDALTERLKPRFTVWRSVTLASDEDLARSIHDDGIQVLVDLAGHTDHNRVPVLAWKPAPVQVSWLGFFASTGLPEVDWLIADPVSVPPPHRVHFVERVWELPHTRLCFTPPTVVIEPGPLPALAHGRLTFGCFQRLPKINDALLRAWAAILRRHAGSRMRLQSMHFDDAGLRAAFLERCSAAGLELDRLVLHGASSRDQYLAAHREIDILLDTFPYTGATTTCEALWMGVPTVTIAGDRLLARQGASLLANLGLEEWVAKDIDDYVGRAVRLAGDLEGLSQLRSELRDRLLTSPLCDARGFASSLQDAMWGMWKARAATAPVCSSQD